MYKNTSGQKVTLLAIDTSTNTPKTGDAANLTAYVSIDDGAVTVLASGATEKSSTNAPGLYDFALQTAETNGNKLVFSGKSSTANVHVVGLPIYTRPPNFSSLTINQSTGLISADMAAISGDQTSAYNLAKQARTVQVGEIRSSGGNSTTQFMTNLTGQPLGHYGNSTDGGNVLVFVSGTANQFQARRITNSKASGVITVESAFDVVPSSVDSFCLLGRIEL